MKSKEEGFGKAEQRNLIRAKVRFEPTSVWISSFSALYYIRLPLQVAGVWKGR